MMSLNQLSKLESKLQPKMFFLFVVFDAKKDEKTDGLMLRYASLLTLPQGAHSSLCTSWWKRRLPLGRVAAD